jgi:hypothetical protein
VKKAKDAVSALMRSLNELFGQAEPKFGAYIMLRGSRLKSGGFAIDVQKMLYRSRLMGWMRPADAFIEMDLEGRKIAIEQLIEDIRRSVPMGTTVNSMDVAWKRQLNGFKNLRIKH